MKFLMLAGSFWSSFWVLGCGGDEPWINVYSHQVTDGDPQNIDSSCGVMGTGTGTTTSGSNQENGYWIEEVTNDEGLSVRLHEGDEITEEHRYDRAFFESGELDGFVLRTPNGEELAYWVWGANGCQDCPPEPYEPLPGDFLCARQGEWDAGSRADGYAGE